VDDVLDVAVGPRKGADRKLEDKRSDAKTAAKPRETRKPKGDSQPVAARSDRKAQPARRGRTHAGSTVTINSARQPGA
jgi:hypothetical protein